MFIKIQLHAPRVSTSPPMPRKEMPHLPTRLMAYIYRGYYCDRRLSPIYLIILHGTRRALLDAPGAFTMRQRHLGDGCERVSWEDAGRLPYRVNIDFASAARAIVGKAKRRLRGAYAGDASRRSARYTRSSVYGARAIDTHTSGWRRRPPD